MKLGVSLSGGGVRGIAHLGLLKALENNGLKPSMMAATSSGAWIAVLYASGKSPEEIMGIIRSASIWKVLRPAFSNKGILDIAKSMEFILPHIKESFEALHIPVTVNATDIERLQKVVYRTGGTLGPLQGASAIPGLFGPVKLGGKLLVDGGIIDNMPVAELAPECDFIIGAHCNPTGDFKKVGNIKQVLERTFQMVIKQNVMLNIHKCDLFFEPPALAAFNVFDIKKAEEIYQIGLLHAEKLMEEMVL